MSDPALIDGSIGKTGGRLAHLPQLRDWWAIDQRERVVRLAQTIPGKLVLVALFAGVAKLAGVAVLYVVLAAAFAYLPRLRPWILLAGSAVALVRNPRVTLEAMHAILEQEGLRQALAPTLAIGALIAYFCCAWLALLLARRYKTIFFVRRPALSLLGIMALLCGLAAAPLFTGLPRAAMWAFVSVFATYLWFLAYGLADQRSRNPSPLLFHMGIFHPFWGSSWTPLGKGASYLRRHQAQTAEELAVTQLKGGKLLVWALVLMAISQGLVRVFEVQLGIPKSEIAFIAFMAGQPFPVWRNWGSLIYATLQGALMLAIWGHKIIAVARLAGFRLQRNTWRPLEARTLAEFWNRYYYYFKELLVEFFFFPTFLKMFRKHPRLRVFCATFMAAGVGNAIYHFIADIKYVAIMGLGRAIESYVSYLVYCTVLAIGIGISQARLNAGHKPATGFFGSLWSVLCVWGFFVLLHVFGDETRAFPFRERCAFFAGLFGF